MSENKNNTTQELKSVYRKVGADESALVEEMITNNNMPPEEAIAYARSKHTDIEKVYVVVCHPYDDSLSIGTTALVEWSRKAVYDHIIEIIDKINIHKSFILTDNSGLSIQEAMEEATVYKVMKKFQEIFHDSEFDIENYNDDNITEGE